MTREQRRTLRALVGSYLAKPDPVAWLAAADLCQEIADEQIDNDEREEWEGYAKMWRDRGTLYPRIADSLERVCSTDWLGDPPSRTVVVDTSPCTVEMYRFSGFIAVSVISQKRIIFRCYHWSLTAIDYRYLTRRIIQLIDQWGDHLNGSAT